MANHAGASSAVSCHTEALPAAQRAAVFSRRSAFATCPSVPFEAKTFHSNFSFRDRGTEYGEGELVAIMRRDSGTIEQ